MGLRWLTSIRGSGNSRSCKSLSLWAPSGSLQHRERLRHDVSKAECSRVPPDDDLGRRDANRRNFPQWPAFATHIRKSCSAGGACSAWMSAYLSNGS
jgi:hypothetical protein